MEVSFIVIYIILAILSPIIWIAGIVFIFRALFRYFSASRGRSESGKAYLDAPRGRWLDRQLKEWVTAGVITGESEERIRGRYFWAGRPGGHAVVARISIIKILVTFGCLLVGTGIIFLISHNWANISPWGKVSVIVAGLVLVQCLGIRLLLRERSSKFGHAVIFLGNIIYGGGIWLVAQIFHINAHFPTGVFLWGLGVIPFAILLRSNLNYFFALFLFALWTILESIYFTKTHLYFVPVFFFVLIPAVYHIRTRTGLVFTYLIGYAWVLTNLYYWTGEEFSPFTLGPMLLYGLALYSLAVLHRHGDRSRYYEAAYYFLAMFLIFAACAAYTLLVFADTGALVLAERSNLAYWAISAFLACLSLYGLLYCIRRRKQYGELAGDGVLIASLFGVFVLFLFTGYLGSTAFIYFLPLFVFCVCLHNVHRVGGILLALSAYFPLWLIFTLARYNSATAIFSMLLVYGACEYAMSLILDARGKRGYAAANRLLGLFIVFAVIYLHTIKDFAGVVAGPRALACSGDFWLLYTVLYCSLGVLIWRSVFKPLGAGRGIHMRELMAFPLFVAPLLYVSYMRYGGIEVPIAIISNVLLFGYIIALLIISYQHDQPETRAFSIAAFVVLVATRYFDIGLTLVTRSVIFISVGVVFIIGSVLLEKRKQSLKIREPHEE